jgi:hypothetical protein
VNFDELAKRAFDEPDHPEVREALPVCADMLEQQNDPRGALVTMELALRDAHPRDALALRRGIDAYVIANAKALGAQGAQPLLDKKLLALEWRAGRIFGATLDTTRVVVSDEYDLVHRVVELPAAFHIRRLRIRKRPTRGTYRIHTALARRLSEGPIEELELGNARTPSEFGWNTEVRWLLEGKYRHVWWYVRDHSLHPLTAATTLRTATLELEMSDATTAQGRMLIGRALTHADAEIRAAAIGRITILGVQARVFARALRSIFTGRLSPDHDLAILEALRTIDPSRATLHLLSQIASRAQNSFAVRRGAGAHATLLRAALHSPRRGP